jgi:hypothetical protein
MRQTRCKVPASLVDGKLSTCAPLVVLLHMLLLLPASFAARNFRSPPVQSAFPGHISKLRRLQTFAQSPSRCSC